MPLQILVAVAVGTLMADALIHLLPHALLEDSSGHGNTNTVWKGFLATLAIICLYLLDNILSMMGHGHSHAKTVDTETESERLSIMAESEKSKINIEEEDHCEDFDNIKKLEVNMWQKDICLSCL